MFPINVDDLHRIEQRAALYRSSSPEFADWASGYGVVKHSDTTQVRVFDLCQQLICEGRYSYLANILDIFNAADRLTNFAMWVVVHMTYANKVYLDGRLLEETDFKENPQGHTGGSLNMVPAYIGYLASNTLTGSTRSWLMGQGHCVAAIDSVNILLGNLYEEQAERYPLTNGGLSRLVTDFYGYAIDEDGRSAAPIGSHVNAHTAGGLIEGGYLGFAELQYVHMPLPGENLVAFLSDGAFEEQRGSDWAARWWRAEDCGSATPVMIANGRRIDQRSTMYQQGGMNWFYKHLEHNGFHPIAIDGRDPAAFIWGILEAESRLIACSEQINAGKMNYPVKLPYVIAETEKGYGFYGAGTNAAHGSPLPGNPRHDAISRQAFNQSARNLRVPFQTIQNAVQSLNSHQQDKRPREKDHVLSRREVRLQLVEPKWLTVGPEVSPMEFIDQQFCKLVQANPQLRVRLGNPDELQSNRMRKTLKLLCHRVLQVEQGVSESITGSVITALNEEAVVCAALGNKGGLNLVVSYEAFAAKMLGAIRQEIIFARHQKEVGRPAKWLSVPIIATSHLWENGKNEQSHQDPLFGEALMAEMSDMVRVVYPADANSSAACLNACFDTQGQIWAMTIAKQPVRSMLNRDQAKQLIRDGALVLNDQKEASVQLIAIGSYQLNICFEVKALLEEKGIAAQVVYILEPGRFRVARDKTEKENLVNELLCEKLFPNSCKLRVFVTHFHAESLLSVCRPLDLGADRCLAFGYANRGGTLDTGGLLKANGCDSATIANAIDRKLAQ